MEDVHLGAAQRGTVSEADGGQARWQSPQTLRTHGRIRRERGRSESQAAAMEQGVADEHRRGRLVQKRRVPGRVARRVDGTQAARRWGPYLDGIEDQRLIAGDHLLHTDPNPGNVLITGDRARAWLVDWAWSTRGAAFIDLACLVPRLIVAGHSPAEAEDWAAGYPAWQDADQAAVTAFSLALARLVRKPADGDPAGDWRQPTAQATTHWARHRSASGRA